MQTFYATNENEFENALQQATIKENVMIILRNDIYLSNCTSQYHINNTLVIKSEDQSSPWTLTLGKINSNGLINNPSQFSFITMKNLIIVGEGPGIFLGSTGNLLIQDSVIRDYNIQNSNTKFMNSCIYNCFIKN